MIVQSHQFGKDRPNVFASRSKLDIEQLLNRMVPRNFVGHRRNIIHAVDDSDVLVEVQYLTKLFEAAVQKPNVGLRIDYHFAIELQHQTQRRMSGRMLRSKIERPEPFAFVGVKVRAIEQF